MSETKTQGEKTDQIDFGFVSYDSEVRSNFDGSTQQLLDQLQTRFDNVEINESKGAWCIRVRVESEAQPSLPLAAIGKSPKKAAERLWRISTFF